MTALDDSNRALLMRLQQQAVLAQRAVARRVAGSISHAVGTPLNVISGRASMLLGEAPGEEELAEYVGIIVEQTRRIVQILRNAAGSLDLDSEIVREVSPAEILTQEVTLVGELCAASGRGLRVRSVSWPSHVRTQAETFATCLFALLHRATSEAAPDTEVDITAALEHAEPPSSERGHVIPGDCLHVVASYTPEAPPVPMAREPWLKGESPSARELNWAGIMGLARQCGAWFELDSRAAGVDLLLNFPVEAKSA